MPDVYKLFDVGYGRKIDAEAPVIFLSSIVWRASHCVYYDPGELYENSARPYMAFDGIDNARKYARECGNSRIACLKLQVERIHRFRDLEKLPKWIQRVWSLPDGTIGVPKLQMPWREEIDVTFMINEHQFLEGKKFEEQVKEITQLWEDI